jgi:hypothetical protein
MGQSNFMVGNCIAKNLNIHIFLHLNNFVFTNDILVTHFLLRMLSMWCVKNTSTSCHTDKLSTRPIHSYAQKHFSLIFINMRIQICSYIKKYKYICEPYNLLKKITTSMKIKLYKYLQIQCFHLKFNTLLKEVLLWIQ